jgi:hypothetical protein
LSIRSTFFLKKRNQFAVKSSTPTIIIAEFLKSSDESEKIYIFNAKKHVKTFRPSYDQYTIEKLKSEIFKKIGWPISNKPDCAKLSELISQSKIGQLSESTLYRLFFQPDKHTLYKTTLDIICKFLGYKDSFEFIEKVDTTRGQLHINGINTLGNKRNSLVFHCIENTAKTPLLNFFEEFDEHSHQFKTDVSITLFDSLLKSSQQDWFFKNFSDQKYIREYFLERGHDTKFRIKNYDQAYLKYLKHVKKDKDIYNFQDFIFGNCVLFRYYFLTKKSDQALQQARILYHEKLNVEAHQNELYIYPFIRYTAYRLWYLEMIRANGFEIESYGLFLIDLCSRLKEKLGFMEQKILFHTIAETFLYSSLPEKFHWNLKDLYKEDYKRLPDNIYQKHLSYSMPYFNENGLLHFRP